MEIIKYDQKYMEQQVVDLWNECCSFDPIDINKFRKQIIFDENFDNDLCYVALQNEVVIGFILGIHRKFPYLEKGLQEDTGWVSVMFVKLEFQKKGIGSSLLTIIENKLKTMGVKKIILAAYSPNYFFSGLDPVNYPDSITFFEQHGYKRGDCHYSMGMNLHGYRISKNILNKKKQVESKGYRFKPFSYEYSIELLDFLKEEFGGGWKRNALIAMQKGVAEDRIYIVLDPTGKICGCANRAIDDNDMRFGPIGISKKERNNGLGSILLACQLYEMCKKGIYSMYFMTTDDAGKRYYERVGLKVIRCFLSYNKLL